MTAAVSGGEVRLAELVAALSLGIDLGLRSADGARAAPVWIALRLAEHLDLDADERSIVYYTALLTNVGCHTDAHEQAKWFGDDIALKGDKYTHGLHGVRSAVAGLRRLGAGQPVLHRFRIGLNFALVGSQGARRHGRPPFLDGPVAGGRDRPSDLRCRKPSAPSYEQWDGKGWPGELRGEAIPIAARVSQVAEFVEVAHRSGGVDSAVALGATARRLPVRSERRVAASARRRTPSSTVSTPRVPGSEVDRRRARAEPGRCRVTNSTQLSARSPTSSTSSRRTLLGHARAVADLVAGLASGGARDGPVTGRRCRRAGLAHGLGRLGVSNAIWDKPGPLGAGEWERVRLQPYLTERILQQSPALRPIGAFAATVPRTDRRLRLSAGLAGARDLDAGSRPGRGRRLPGDARTATSSASAETR